METPYGGRIVFEMPGSNKLIIHLKDKSKVRIKKRWSQILYMYLLLGYKYFGSLSEMERLYSRKNNNNNKKSELSDDDDEFIGFGNLLKNVDPNIRAKVRSQN